MNVVWLKIECIDESVVEGGRGATNSPEGEPQHGLIGGAGFQILSALTSRLWPDFTWQRVQFCPNRPPPQKQTKKELRSWQRNGLHCGDNEGIWAAEGGG